jgi:hypothetical protein
MLVRTQRYFEGEVLAPIVRLHGRAYGNLMQDQQGLKRAKWPLRRRLLHATVGFFVHLMGQGIRLGIEAFASVTGRADLRDEQRAVRTAAALYREAQVLDRRGQTQEAFDMAKQAFGALKATDHRETYVQVGGLVATFLDQLASELGNPAAARPELEDLLRVLKGLQSSSATKLPALDHMVRRIENRMIAKS